MSARRRLVVAAIGLALVGPAGCAGGTDGVPGRDVATRPPASPSVASTSAPSAAPSSAPASPPASPPAPTLVRRTSVFGRSVRGRPLVVTELGDSAASDRRILVVGAIHGNEPAGIAIATALVAGPAPTGIDLFVVPDLNPDGVSADTRQNADRVDLNRNFPYDWQPLGRPGDQQYSGPGPLSEPESRAAADLIRRIRPAVTIWFHQPLGLVDESGGVLAVQQRFAAAVGLPLRQLTRYPGSAASWQDRLIPGTSAFVVELPPVLPASAVPRFVQAVLTVLPPR